MEIRLETADSSSIANKRSEMVAMLEARKADRLAARDSRRNASESLLARDGGNVNVARSSDEFWSLFNAGAKSSCCLNLFNHFFIPAFPHSYSHTPLYIFTTLHEHLTRRVARGHGD